MLTAAWNFILSKTVGGEERIPPPPPRVPGKKYPRCEEREDARDCGDEYDGTALMLSPEPKSQEGSVLITTPSPRTKRVGMQRKLSFDETNITSTTPKPKRRAADHLAPAGEVASLPPDVALNGTIADSRWRVRLQYTPTSHRAKVPHPAASDSTRQLCSPNESLYGGSPWEHARSRGHQHGPDAIDQHRAVRSHRWKEALTRAGTGSEVWFAARQPSVSWGRAGSHQGSLNDQSTDSFLRMLSGRTRMTHRSSDASSLCPQLPQVAEDSESDEGDDFSSYEGSLDHLVATAFAALSRGRSAAKNDCTPSMATATAIDSEREQFVGAIVELREARAAAATNMVVQRGDNRPQAAFGGCKPTTSIVQNPAAHSRAERCTYPGLSARRIAEALQREVASGERLSLTLSQQTYNQLRGRLLSISVNPSEPVGMNPDVQLLSALHCGTQGLCSPYVSTVAEETIQSTWTSLYELVRRQVVGLTVALCPQPEGVIRHIESKTPATVPVKFTAPDEAKMATLEGYPQRGAYVINDRQLGYQIERYQLESGLGREKVNDQVMNYYCSLIAQQVDGVATLLSSFYTKLLEAVNVGDTEFPAALRWTRKRDIFGSQIVLVVINQHDHWTLCVVHNKNKTITYYDSCGGSGTEVMANVAAFFDYAFEQGNKSASVSSQRAAKFTSGYTFHSPRKMGVPQQVGAVDCGVFALQFSLYAALERPFNFRQEDIPYLRRLIVLELLCGRLMERL